MVFIRDMKIAYLDYVNEDLIKHWNSKQGSYKY